MSESRNVEAKKWWGDNVNDRPVWRTKSLPAPWYKGILVAQELAHEITRDVLMLGKPKSKWDALMYEYAWQIISVTLDPYKPYAIRGLAAMNFCLGDESVPRVIEIASRSSNKRLHLGEVCTLKIEKDSDFFSAAEGAESVRVSESYKGYELYFESPEAVLSNVRLSLIRDNPGKFASFLKSTDFNEGRLFQRIENDGKPVRYLRHADTLRQVGRAPLAEKIEKMVRAQTEYRVSRPPRKMLVRLPDALAQPKRESDSPAVNRFRDQMRLYGMKLNEAFSGLAVTRHDDVGRIIAFAEETKKYDAYHSSTIEGYRVSEEEIQAIIDGKPVEASGDTPEEIRTKMALKGYLEAHNFVLEQIRKAFAKAEPLEESLITEIYARLFSPTVEAGLLKKEELTRYRTEPVYLRLSRYVPPNHRHINELMSALVEEVNRLKDPVVRAVMLHYGFVTVHPYKDGNGRLGRFSMNYVLGVNGMRWTTIRAEDKTRYFKALEGGQVDGRIEPFGEFVLEYLRSSGTRAS